MPLAVTVTLLVLGVTAIAAVGHFGIRRESLDRHVVLRRRFRTVHEEWRLRVEDRPDTACWSKRALLYDFRSDLGPEVGR